MKKFRPFIQVYLHPRCFDLGSQAYYFFRSNLLGKKLSFPYVVLSFPKSGRTWIRAILGKYLELTHGVVFTTEFDNLTMDKLPKIKFTHNLHRMSYFSGKIIFLTRDPRDVIVSYYYQKKYRDNAYCGSMSDFIRDKQYGFRHLIAFMNGLVRLHRLRPNSLLVTYEQLHANPYTTIEAVLSFLDLSLDRKRLTQAIDFCSFENMQQLEKEGGFLSFRLQPSDPTNLNTYKVRKGKVGGYKDELELNDLAYLDALMSKRFTGRFIYS